MIRLIILSLLILLPGSASAVEPKLVPDVSQRQIKIQTGFTGARLLLFGAIIYPRGVAPTGQVDVAIVLRGPTQAITLREKQQIAGIWVNAESNDFRSVPTYYAVASSRPLNKIVDAKTAAIYELGLERMQLSPSGEIVGAEQRRFIQGLVDLNQRQGLYRQEDRAVEITDNVLYRAYLDIPSSVPVGTYTAETLLIRNGRVIVADDNVEIEIQKTGFEQFITVMADKYSLLYGLLAVIISLGLGWLAGVIFRRV
ncbi:TIGR02186 family protein [Sphingorhabdus arenilitoris]|uniref:TIGR02186 family protein n=1 Tax=Sphingorhabdus arenilitoris TaxID=1490041 RepID=A0ABV8REC3_9SPHN